MSPLDNAMQVIENLRNINAQLTTERDEMREQLATKDAQAVELKKALEALTALWLIIAKSTTESATKVEEPVFALQSKTIVTCDKQLTTPPDQSERVAELEKVVAELEENANRLANDELRIHEKNLSIQAQITALQHLVAALQAKEPVLLSEDDREKLFEEWCVESELADWLILATEQAVLKANGFKVE